MKEERISPWQAALLMAGFFLGTSVIVNPAATSGSDSWLSGLVVIAVGLIIIGITTTLAVLHPGKSLVGILISCFGRTAGKIIGFGYLLFSAWLVSEVILTFSYYDITLSYEHTPILFISICSMILVAFCVKLGLEVLCRLGEVFVLIIIFTTLLTLLSLITSFHPDAFLPLFKDGFGKPLLAGLMNSVLPFAECFLALNILPNLNDQKKNHSAGRNAVLIAGGMMYLTTLRNIGVLGVDVAARNIYPSEKIFKLLPAINVIPLLDANVFLSGSLKTAFVLYTEAKILGDLFELKDFKIFVLPLATLDIVSSVFVGNNVLSKLFVAAKIVPLAYIPILIIMPLIMLIISLIRKKSREQRHNGLHHDKKID